MKCGILYVVGRLHTGGLERQLYYLLRAMNRERYKPAVVSWDYREEDSYVSRIQGLGVPIYPLLSVESGRKKLKAFRGLVRELKPEVVHSYNGYTNFAVHWGCCGTGAVAVGSVRSDFTWGKK